MRDFASMNQDEAGPALETRGVTLKYGSTQVLRDVSLEVGLKESVALVGESGAGKTTLLRMFNRMVVPDDGFVGVAGRDVTKLDSVRLRRSIGYIQQEGGLLPHWTVTRNVGLVPWLTRMENPSRLAQEALERVGLSPRAFGGRLPRELSGGERQRVAVARAIAARPGIILMDEPFGALDAITRATLTKNVGELFHEIGVSALMVTHDLHVAMAFADRVAVLREGKLEQIDTPEALCSAPATGYVADLLQSAGVEVQR